MGMPKRNNHRKKDNQKPVKKKNEKKMKKNQENEDYNKNQDGETEKYIDEFKGLREIMKSKNMTHMPLLVAATVLENIDYLHKLLTSEYDPNQTDSNGQSAVFYAAKNKRPDIVELLESHGANLGVVDHHGDNILLAAVNSKIWDEKSYIVFYENVLKSGVISANDVNQLGNSLVHYSVKRNWLELLEKLISDGAKLNFGNHRGITPLMMCTARNQPEAAKLLLSNGAKLTSEDDRSCTAVCYAMANVVQKKLRPPHTTLDILVGNWKRDRWKEYLERRLEILINPREENSGTFHEVSTKIILPGLSFIKNTIPEGPNIFLELEIFKKLKQALEKHLEYIEYVISLLAIVSELLLFCDCCIKFEVSNDLKMQNTESFLQSNIFETCLNILKRCESNVAYSSNKSIPQAALLPLILVLSNEDLDGTTLKEKFYDLNPYHHHFSHEFGTTMDEHRQNLIKQKLEKFLTKFDSIQKEFSTIKVSGSSEDLKASKNPKDENYNLIESDSTDKKHNSKKIRRKAKALKAKIDKIRRADILERANYCKSSSEIFTEKEEFVELEKENPQIQEILPKSDNISVILDPNFSEEPQVVPKVFAGTSKQVTPRDPDEISVKEIVEKQDLEPETTDLSPEEIQKINETIESILTSHHFDKSSQIFPKNTENELKAQLGARIIRLQVLLSNVIERYEKHWKMDRKLGYPDFLGTNGDGPSFLQGNREDQVQKLDTVLPILEERYISKLKENFHRILDIIMTMFRERNNQYESLASRLEEALINHEVRGEKIVIDLPDSNDPFIDFEETPKNCGVGAIGDHLKKKPKLLEDFGKPYGSTSNEPQEEINLEELSKFSFPDKCFDEKDLLLENKDNKSLSNTFLVDTFNRIDVNDSSKLLETTQDCKEQLFPVIYKKNEDDFMVQAKANFFTILSNENRTLHDMTDKSFYYQNRPFSEILRCGYEMKLYKDIGKSVTRWEFILRHLQNLIKRQLLGKKAETIITSPAETRHQFIISSGGNFGDVEIALDRSGRALAIKRISRQQQQCGRAVLSHVRPLVQMRHKNVLQYTACEFLGQELVIATPLCEFNLGEYLMCLKMNRGGIMVCSPTTDQLIRQMLSGLKYLHNRPEESIVHGNLKPSNVLIDVHGQARLAEFGIHKTLYKNCTPPNSSIIWFARETYEKYQRRNIIQCTTCSDIQVMGMLIHFVLSGGLHPFGILADDIVENLVRGTPRLSIMGVEIEDLVTWMLLFEASDRPNINQIISHVYFWDSQRKWEFLLTCCGADENSQIIMEDTDQFHNALNILAVRHQVTGDWVSVISEKLPFVQLTDGLNSDTPSGVLRFLRMCIELKNNDIHNGFKIDLKSFFLNTFPALPLSLYRLIENTEWLNHPSFSQFTNQEII